MIEFDSRKQNLNTPRAESVVWTLKSLETLVERKDYSMVRSLLPDCRLFYLFFPVWRWAIRIGQDF